MSEWNKLDFMSCYDNTRCGCVAHICGLLGVEVPEGKDADNIFFSDDRDTASSLDSKLTQMCRYLSLGPDLTRNN
ncbi:hypothetical protein PROFUN_06336 [Planoprotostelium fungivorum]|uniref:Uncharacterized protein n=1 Tax=Planoprotostelium fungivorum TaxID=1890364 RepID=A0A2P6NP60_9EUKA|nr:hypothetical protein PROFUN_06336 [Planoprotostelium fungivorum]